MYPKSSRKSNTLFLKIHFFNTLVENGEEEQKKIVHLAAPPVADLGVRQHGSLHHHCHSS